MPQFEPYSITIYTLLLILVVSFFAIIFGAKSKYFEKIIGGLAILVFALVQKNEILSLIAIFIGGLLIATETFLLYLASIFRSKENTLGTLMKQYNAHINLQLSQPTPAEKLRKLDKAKRRILAAKSESSRDALPTNKKSKESLDAETPPMVVASAPATVPVPIEMAKVSSKKSAKICEEMSDVYEKIDDDYARVSTWAYPDAPPDERAEPPTEWAEIIDFTTLSSQLSAYFSNWVEVHPELIRMSETKASTNEGTYIFDELFGNARKEWIMFGLEYDYVLPFHILSRETQVQELKDTLSQITKIWFPFPVVLVLASEWMTEADEIYFSEALETKNSKIVAFKIWDSGIEPVSQKFEQILAQW